jgi:iron complex transport system ATP-binding protein
MVLCQDTDYVLLDEPLNNLDMKHAVEMVRLLRRMADKLGKTAIIVLHDLNFVSCYADHIVTMKGGQLRYQGSPETIMQPAVLQDLYEVELDIHVIDARRIAVYYR